MTDRRGLDATELMPGSFEVLHLVSEIEENAADRGVNPYILGYLATETLTRFRPALDPLAISVLQAVAARTARVGGS